jgi:Membrane bound O-acyl transferase family
MITGTEWTYDILAILCVSLHLGGPSDWPPIFGSFFKNSYTIRGFWGRFYHQWLRRNVSTAGMLVNKLFGFKQGSVANRYSQLIVAFAVSAFFHHVGAFVGCYKDDGFWQASFFLVQPVGIIVEENVISMGRKLGIRKTGELISASFFGILV